MAPHDSRSKNSRAEKKGGRHTRVGTIEPESRWDPMVPKRGHRGAGSLFGFPFLPGGTWSVFSLFDNFTDDFWIAGNDFLGCAWVAEKRTGGPTWPTPVRLTPCVYAEIAGFVRLPIQLISRGSPVQSGAPPPNHNSRGSVCSIWFLWLAGSVDFFRSSNQTH